MNNLTERRAELEKRGWKFGCSYLGTWIAHNEAMKVKAYHTDGYTALRAAIAAAEALEQAK